jgi:hypothetical protein
MNVSDEDSHEIVLYLETLRYFQGDLHDPPPPISLHTSRSGLYQYQYGPRAKNTPPPPFPRGVGLGLLQDGNVRASLSL